MPALLGSGIPEIVLHTKRDLLGEDVDTKDLWQLPGLQRVLNKQQPDGSFKYPNPKPDIRGTKFYDLLETYRQLGFLVEMYNLNQQHEAVQKAKKFISSFQTKEGDIRGIYWNQYSPNYTAGILELLIKAGYTQDAQVEKGLQWLLTMRQDDGGWAIPVRTEQHNLQDWSTIANPVPPDRTKPFSYMVTGVVLRAFAYHPKYKTLPQIRTAAELVLSRIFQKDTYPDRNAASYWTSFSFPFWYTDLIAVLDPIANLGFTPTHSAIKKGLAWFVDKQNKDGTWSLKMLKGEKRIQPYWHNLNICRLFKKYYTAT